MKSKTGQIEGGECMVPLEVFSWARLIYQAGLRGTAAMIACHCEVKKYDPQELCLLLELDRSMFALAKTPAMRTMKEKIADSLGVGFYVTVEAGDAANSPSKRSHSKRVAAHALALEVVMQEPLVSDLLKKWQGLIVMDAIEIGPLINGKNH